MTDGVTDGNSGTGGAESRPGTVTGADGHAAQPHSDRADVRAVDGQAHVEQDAGTGAGDGDEVAVRVRARGLRRRRANAPGGRHHVHKVRVTPEEEALLLQRATVQRVTIPRLLVEAALAGGGETATASRNAVEELLAVHRLLASVSNNVNQIARATNATFELQPETSATLAAVRRLAERIDEVVDGLTDGLSGPGGR